jgi:hypothetical protein
MGIWFRTTDKQYEFSCSFTLWDEIRTAYIQAFIYFLGDWIQQKNDYYEKWRDSNNYDARQQYKYFQDIKLLYNELMNVSDNDYDSVIKLYNEVATNKYNESIEEMLVFNGICDLLQIDIGKYIVIEQTHGIIHNTELIYDFFNATIDKDILNFKDFLINVYSNNLTIIVS